MSLLVRFVHKCRQQHLGFKFFEETSWRDGPLLIIIHIKKALLLTMYTVLYTLREKFLLIQPPQAKAV